MALVRPMQSLGTRSLHPTSRCQIPLTSSFRSAFTRRCLHARNSTPRSHCDPLRKRSSNTLQVSAMRQIRYNSNNPRSQLDVTSNLGSPPNQTLSQRLKALSKEYGWTALGVYLALSALDFPFCYLAVQLLGPERVGKAEHAIIDFVRSMVQAPFPDLMQTQEEVEVSRRAAADSEKGSKATVWTQLVLAYAVHKSLIFFRVPLTAAVLPKVVKTLRSYGWKVGKTSPKAVPSSTTSASRS